MPKKISEQLADLLIRAGNYSSIARATGLDPSQIARLAKGERAGRKETLDKIGLALNLVLTPALVEEGGPKSQDDRREQQIRSDIRICSDELSEISNDVERLRSRMEKLARLIKRLGENFPEIEPNHI